MELYEYNSIFFTNLEVFLNQTLLTFLLYVDKLGWFNWFWQFLCYSDTRILVFWWQSCSFGFICDHLRDFLWEDSFKLGASAASSFCERVQVGIDVLYQQKKSAESKVKFRQAGNHCKRVLEAAKLAYANKAKEPVTSQKLGSWDF